MVENDPPRVNQWSNGFYFTPSPIFWFVYLVPVISIVRGYGWGANKPVMPLGRRLTATSTNDNAGAFANRPREARVPSIPGRIVLRPCAAVRLLALCIHIYLVYIYNSATTFVSSANHPVAVAEIVNVRIVFFPLPL